MLWLPDHSIMKPPVGSIVTPDFVGYDNLLGLWLMNEGGGNKVFDLTGNGRDGVFVGDTAWVPGKFGPALQFVTDDYVTIPFSADNGLSQISLSVWLRRPDGAPIATEYPFCHYAGSGEFVFRFQIATDGDVTIGINNSDDTDVWADTINHPLADRQWHHFAAVYNGVDVRIYGDAQLSGGGEIKALTGVLDTCSQPVTLGIIEAGGTDYTGLLDLPAIWNRALTASEIAELYDNPFRGIGEQGGRFCLVVIPGGGEAIVRTINDSLGTSDIPTRIHAAFRTIAESMGTADANASGHGKSLADALGMVDARVKDEGKAIAESLGITDSLSQIAVILRAIGDSIAITDSVSDVWTVVRTIADSLGITDEMIESAGAILRTINNSIGLTDSPVRTHIALRSIADNVGLADALARLIVVSRLVSDSLGITDGVVLDRLTAVTDTLGITDDVSRLVAYVRTQDEPVGIGDSMVRVAVALRTVNDGVGISDVASEQLGELLKAAWAFLILRQVTN